jgi:aminopeptidase N
MFVAGVAVVAVGAGFAPAPAPAAAKKPRLTITSLASHHGARIGPRERFHITGVVRNNWRATSSALVGASLRFAGKTRFALGAASLVRVPGHRSRKFTIHATGPLRAAGAPPRRFALSACVRRRRGARSTCLHLKKGVLVIAPSRGGGSNGGNGGGTGGGGTGGGGGTAFTAGSRSGGDRLFPQIGNGGYDATHYDLTVRYDPATKLLQGTAKIDAVARQNLSEYSFDLFDMPVSSVLVGGAPATFKQEAGKLIVTPPQGIPASSAFTTTVTYASTIAAYTDPDGSSEGWVPSTDGAFVVNEPVGAMTWFPTNNVPTDKATYAFHVTVPGTREVIANGRLVSDSANADGTHTWKWVESAPMASYLVTATNGEFDVTTDASKPAVPAYYALDSSYNAAQKSAMQSRLSQTPSILDFYASFLSTPYPYDAAGGVIDRSPVGYALETQTKPMYAVNSGADPSSPGLDTISHELAHQWFGDDVSPATWSDIWLNEGPAEFFSWLWQERSSNSPLTTKQRFDTNYANPAMDWSVPPAAPPTAADIFDTDAMYTRGAMVMEALREIVGEDKFKAVLKTYLASHQYGNASTRQFIDLWKSEGGKSPAQLDVFFREWLYGTEKPGINPSNFDTYTP